MQVLILVAGGGAGESAFLTSLQEEGSEEGREVVTFCFRENRAKNGMQGFKWTPSKGIRPMGNGSYKWQVVGLNSVLIL